MHSRWRAALTMPMAANTVIATNTISRGISTASSHASQAESPMAPRTTTSAGVKQQMAVTTVPTMPKERSCLRRMLGLARWTPLLAIALAGCGASKEDYTRDASGAVVIHCDRSELRWNACYDKAARLCGEAGYQIVGESEGGAPTATTNVYEVPVIGGSLIIRCNP